VGSAAANDAILRGCKQFIKGWTVQIKTIQMNFKKMTMLHKSHRFEARAAESHRVW
jgi:phosphoribulokinase